MNSIARKQLIAEVIAIGRQAQQASDTMPIEAQAGMGQGQRSVDGSVAKVRIEKALDALVDSWSMPGQQAVLFSQARQ
ncbi:MAG: hypothetical protein R3C56_21875 [Pirellulaceae bacterium]